MWRLAALPFLLQAGLMLADERFHRRRGLPAWERWGHPLDTFLAAACYALALWAPATPAGLSAYAGACALSCLCVTKDEWVHARHCTGAEGWLHACLFLLHPVLFAIVGWWAFAGAFAGAGAGRSGPEASGFGVFVAAQTALTAAFGIWQAAYWNGPWGRARPVHALDERTARYPGAGPSPARTRGRDGAFPDAAFRNGASARPPRIPETEAP